MQVANFYEMEKEELIHLLESIKNSAEPEENRIRYPQDALRFVKKQRKRKTENFTVIILDGAHNVIQVKDITKGLVNRTIVHPREVFRPAIQKNAVAVIAVHNHPSGNPHPSDEDKQITTRLKEAGEIMGIKLLDHLVVTEKSYYSFVEQMLL